MPYTLGQAAKATGRSKPTIQRAIKNGSISAVKAIDGSYEIDPAELHRVFPPANDTGNVEQHLKQSDTPSDTNVLQREVGVLRERLADKDSVIEDLRRRLDQSEQERRDKDRQLTALLTDQRPEKQQEPPPAKRRWRLWGRG
jgi:excisionase family DNA binding protein